MELENINKNQSEMNNTMKTTLGGINSRFDEAEDWISDLEGSRKHPIRIATRKKDVKKKKLKTV